jgi:deoxyribonuclease V
MVAARSMHRQPKQCQHYTMKGMKKKRVEEARQHRWDVTPGEAREIQDRLRGKWEGQDRLGEIRTIGGLDAAFVLNESQALKKRLSRWERLREANQAIGCVVVYRPLCDPRAQPLRGSGQAGMAVPLEEIERAYAVVPLEFPYIPGLLSFREIPALLAALGKLREMPDLLFCDGQGYAHPRRFGLAAHLGVLLDVPAIGCAKSILIGEHGEPGKTAGSWTELVDPKNGERIGAAVRARDGVKPMYVSQGNRVSLDTAIRMTLAVSDGFRIPRPTREADRFAGEVKRKLVES